MLYMRCIGRFNKLIRSQLSKSITPNYLWSTDLYRNADRAKLIIVINN